jgi:general secretion pathway protein G
MLTTHAGNCRSGHRLSGFTLIEVLLVLIILVILGSLAVNVFTGTQDRANIDAATAQTGLVRSAIDLYRLHMIRYPSKLEDLWVEPSDSDEADKWNGPYMEKLKPDPWGTPYQYSAEGKKNKDKYDFWSNGPDRKSGTDDDIGNWE